MLPWIALQAAGTIDGLVSKLLQLNQLHYVVVAALIETYGWLCVVSLYQQIKRRRAVVRFDYK